MLNIIGLAYRANCLVYGIEQVSEVVNTKKARLIITTSDANPKTIEKASSMPERCNALYSTIPFTAEELGAALGVETCGIAAFTDVGFSASFAEKLKEQDAAQFEMLAIELDRQNIRAKKRKAKKLRNQ